ncbi:acyltransferase [Cupriavidus sp. AU9028]|uniref:acyltransferase n=1 Tax=Cupriavidus sp. AU9028 TaxID=2871157 RepID=UPI001C98D8CE|nr:acyltransferase [Cupriavidus sp. AU9028]MBY4896840.1 acyltransferase [Cupriavidus sp. AU9028]
MMRRLLATVSVALPWRLRRQVLNRFCGARIDPTARIGWSLVLCDELEMGPHSVISHLTVVKGLRRVSLGDHAILGSLNWVSGFPQGLADSPHFRDIATRDPALIIGRHAAVTSRHIIDCTDTVTIGPYSTFAGYRSQILTHSVSIKESRQRCAPVTIGAYCFVGTGSILLPGAALPDYSVLAAGAVLNRSMAAPHMLYGGCPARALQELPEDLAYFTREEGYIV